MVCAANLVESLGLLLKFSAERVTSIAFKLTSRKLGRVHEKGNARVSPQVRPLISDRISQKSLGKSLAVFSPSSVMSRSTTSAK